MDERESDWISAAELLGIGKKAWPPDPLAPGIRLRRRAIRAKGLQQALGRSWMIEPVMVDTRPFYAAVALRHYREEDEAICATCHGARYVRWERPVGHPMHGQIRPCPQACWTKKPQKKGEPWWSK